MSEHTVEANSNDPWASWLLKRRHGGDERLQHTVIERMKPVRDKVIANAKLKAGDILLDVGTGDGLIGFGAIEKVGADGSVIFSDISQQLLDTCKSCAAEAGLLDRCQFIIANATDLSAINSESVDAVTTRSVIIYVADKQRAFDEFFRVLKPGGHLSIFEPIAKLGWEFVGRDYYHGYDIRPIKDVMDKVAEHNKAEHNTQSTMGDFDERDLIKMLQQSGFSHIELDLNVTVGKAGLYSGNWEAFYNSSPNPLASSLREKFEAALTEEEQERAIAHLRPLVESNTGHYAQCLAFLRAEK
ncbi:MAG TPA: class I SAM-dependent methyltransferase [Candidatus Kapabacteria bacterium]|jgi:ubiquinone/menaquinone biosynthesis C-methylase UbiE|nr:class I SAM-dependent methyltransferase [Candidatus Kapabacteria bacterium]